MDDISCGNTQHSCFGDSQIVEVVKEVVDTCEGVTLVRLDLGMVTVDCADPEGLGPDCVCDEPVMVSEIVCVVPGTF